MGRGGLCSKPNWWVSLISSVEPIQKELINAHGPLPYDLQMSDRNV